MTCRASRSDPAVRVGRRQRELPRPDTEPAGQLLADPGRVLGREHVGDAAAQSGVRPRRSSGPDRGRPSRRCRRGTSRRSRGRRRSVKCAPVGATRHTAGTGPAHLTIQGIGTPSRSERLRALVERRRARVGVGEAALLVGHQAGEAVAIESDGGGHPVRMAGSRRACGHPASRDLGHGNAGPGGGPASCRGRVGLSASVGSVDPADEPADVAGGRSRSRGSSSRKLGQPLVPQKRRLELTACGGRSATHTAHRGGSSGDGRCGGTGHHGDV